MTECPKLTEVTASTVVITKDLIDDLLVSTYSRTVGTSVTVSCREGFTLVGPSTVTCRTDVTWSGNPYCTDGPVTSQSPSKDESMVLIIVLLVVSALVAALIVFVCIAMLWGRSRQGRLKRYSNEDNVTEHSFSVHDNKIIPMRTTYSPGLPAPSAPYELPEYRPRYSRHMNLYPQYYTQNWAAEYNLSPRFARYRHDGYSARLRTLPRARSLDDLNDEVRWEYPPNDTYENKISRDRRRDGYLWRRMSLSDWNIPRPQYED